MLGGGLMSTPGDIRSTAAFQVRALSQSWQKCCRIRNRFLVQNRGAAIGKETMKFRATLLEQLFSKEIIFKNTSTWVVAEEEASVENKKSA